MEATRRSLNKDFLLALGTDFKRHGPQVIEKVRKTQPAAYLKICALLVPREMKVERSAGVKGLALDGIVKPPLGTFPHRDVLRRQFPDGLLQAAAMNQRAARAPASKSP